MHKLKSWISIVLVSISWSMAFADLPQKEFEVKKFADGVYGFIWKDPTQNPIEGNSLFVINDNDVLVVDACLFPSSTRLMIRELEKLTSKPVRYVVNTHCHDDHVNGNFVYRERWPGVEFIAQRNTRQDIIDQVINVRPQDIQGFRDNIKKFTGWMTSGKDDNGTPLDDARKKRVQGFLELFEQSIIEYGNVKDAPPDLTFGDSLVLHRGSRVIKIMWLGRGNTRGDAVVFLPNERIAATGDLFVYPIPFAFGSYYEEWITTLSKVDSLQVDVLFPGHGPPQYDRMYIHQVQGLLKSLVDEVGKRVASGATLEETQEQVTLNGWREKFTMKDPAKERAFDQVFKTPAVEGAWHQIKGEAGGH